MERDSLGEDPQNLHLLTSTPEAYARLTVSQPGLWAPQNTMQKLKYVRPQQKKPVRLRPSYQNTFSTYLLCCHLLVLGDWVEMTDLKAGLRTPLLFKEGRT